MKRLLAFFIVTILLATPALAKKLTVFVSVVPQQYIVEKIGGTLVNTKVLVQPGANPATYEPKPRQMAELARAELYFAVGVPFEAVWLPRIESANPIIRVVHMEAEIKRIPMAAHHHHGEEEEHGDHHDHPGEHAEDHDHHGILDPHVWTAPPLVRIMAEKTLHALQKADPVHADIYAANHARFDQEIETLHADLEQIFSNVPDGARFMVYHPAWGYFANTYHLTQVPVEMEGKAPGPKELKELIRYARESDIHVIFVQPQFSRKSAELIARSIDGKVLAADPLAKDWASNLRQVALTFKSVARK